VETLDKLLDEYWRAAQNPSNEKNCVASEHVFNQRVETRAFTRREVLRWGLLGSAVALLPGTGLLGCGENDAFLGNVNPVPSESFLTADELSVVTAVTARIVPTDEMPGAIEAGAANYINRLLSVLPDEHSAGEVFGGGPFSGRNPFPDSATGSPSTQFPPDNFTQFIPLTRLQLMSWRVQLLGTAAVPGSDFNVPVLGPVIGLRDQYRAGLASIQSKSQELFQADFAALTPDQQDAVLGKISQDFVDLLTGHTLEGMFCAPEYGGNTNGVGWGLIGYDGDSQPLGYSIFDESTGSYNERPGGMQPTSTANPHEDCSGVDAATQKFLRVLVSVANPGTPSFAPGSGSMPQCP
jgi:hypothetical protein